MKKKKGWTKLSGQLIELSVYLNLSNGDVQFRYGNLFKSTKTNIKGTELYDAVVKSYGTKEGQKIREKAGAAIIGSIKFG